MLIFDLIGIILLLTVSFLEPVSGIASCRDSFYLQDGVCVECPSTCNTCTSMHVCTSCKDEYFGTNCNKTCEQLCPSCHQKYGYCKYGCLDGFYGSRETGTCTSCPDNCTLCSSFSFCIECEPGFNGASCEYKCSDVCVDKTCNKTTGECDACPLHYYRRGNSCEKCPHNCAGCIDASDCTDCKEYYTGPIDGKCYLECPNKQTTYQVLQVRENECLSKDSSSNIDPGMCEYILKDRPIACSTKRHCVSVSDCLPGSICHVDVHNMNNKCATVMIKSCRNICQPLVQENKLDQSITEDNAWLCQQTCSAEPLENETFSSICVNGRLTFPYPTLFEEADRELNITTTCVDVTVSEEAPGGDDTVNDDDSVNDEREFFSPTNIVIVNISVLMFIIICAAAIVWRCRSRKASSSSVQLSVQSEYHLNMEPQEEEGVATGASVAVTSSKGRHQEAFLSGESSDIDRVTIECEESHDEYNTLETLDEHNYYVSIQDVDDYINAVASHEASGSSVPRGRSADNAVYLEAVGEIPVRIQQTTDMSVAIRQPSDISVNFRQTLDTSVTIRQTPDTSVTIRQAPDASVSSIETSDIPLDGATPQRKSLDYDDCDTVPEICHKCSPDTGISNTYLTVI